MQEQTTQKIRARVVGAIVAAGLMSFCGVIVETSLNIAFPTLMAEFHVGTGTVQWLTTGYLLVVAMMVPLSATFKRKFKMKQLFLTAITLFTIGIVLDAFAPVFGVLLLGRLVQALGTGIALPLMFNIILEQVPLSKIGMMMGVGTLIMAVAPAIGPTFGGVVIATMSWRFIFAFLIPFLIISLVLGTVCIEQKVPTQPTTIDVVSLLTIIVMFGGFILGFSNLSTHAPLSMAVAGCWLIGIIGLIGLLVRSRQVENPVIALNVFKNWHFSGHVVSFFIFQMISLGLSFIIPNYIQLVNHSSSMIAGLVVLPGSALGACLAPVSGRILDHFGARLPLIMGSVLNIIALALFSCLSLKMANVAVMAIYILFMLGTGTAFGNIMTSGLKQLDETQQSDGNAIMNTIQQFAGAVGTSIVSAMIAHSQATLTVGRAQSTAIGTQHAYTFLLIALVIELVIIVWSLKGAKQ